MTKREAVKGQWTDTEDGRRNDNMQTLFSPGCEQPLRDTYSRQAVNSLCETINFITAIINQVLSSHSTFLKDKMSLYAKHAI